MTFFLALAVASAGAPQVLNEWLALCNARDEAKLASWHEEYDATQMAERRNELARDDAGACASSGGYAIVAGKVATPERVVVSVTARKTGVPMQAMLRLDENGKIAGFGVRPAPP